MKVLFKVIAVILLFAITFLSLNLISATVIYASAKSPENIFKEVDRVKLDFGDVVFANTSKIVPLQDGFIVLIDETAYTKTHTLLKFSKKGTLLNKYDRRGNGPGELRSVGNIIPLENSILVSESSAPFVHEFSHDLKFVKDHRIKKGGKILDLGKYFGIWALNYKRENNKDKVFILALYDRNTFEFKKFAFEIPEVPAYVFTWGGICRVDENTFAGAYVTQHKIYLFDSDLKLKKSILGDLPGYMKKYHPWKKSHSHADNTSVEWLKSWSKIDSLYYIDGKFIVKHLLENKCFLDIISLDGKPLLKNYQESKNSSLLFTEDPYVWLLEWNDDRTTYYLVKVKIELKSRLL
jgi:hypothetical protein